MHTYALTGGIGAGKSAVGRILGQMGAHILDADATARALTSSPGPVIQQIITRFPTADDGADGIDRSRLAQIVFSDDAARADLEAIMHPAIRRQMAQRSEEIIDRDRRAIIIHDIPLLTEIGRASEFAGVILVRADRDVRIARLLASREITEKEIVARMAAQASDAQRARIATWTIDNSDSYAALQMRVRRVWQMLSTRHDQLAAQSY